MGLIWLPACLSSPLSSFSHFTHSCLPHQAQMKPAFQLSSVTQSCLTLCDPMNLSIPGLPVHHQLPESTQTHVHQVGDAIQPSHPLLSPSPPSLNLPQHPGLFKWVLFASGGKVLQFQLQHLNPNFRMFGRSNRIAAIYTQDAQWSLNNCIHDGHMGEKSKK